MQILFLQPPLGGWCTWGRHNPINVSHAQLAACIRQWAPEVKLNVLDCRALEMNEMQMLDAVSEIKPELIYMGDLLQTTGVAAIAYRYHQAAKLIKSRHPDMKICTGGFFYGANAQKMLEKTPEVDFIISGETEVTFVELAKELSKIEPDIPSVKGLAYREDGTVRLTDYRPLIENLDDLPMPAYDLFPMNKYIGFNCITPYAEIYTTRGCPNGCRFCVGWSLFDARHPQDFKCYRYKSGKRLAEELALLDRKYGVQYVCIMDDDFNVQRTRVKEAIEEISKQDLNLKFWLMGRAPYFLRDADLLGDLNKAGCVGVLVGLEAVDDPTLKSIEKRIKVEQVEEVVKKFRENGIASNLTWMIGFPEDDEERVKERFFRVDQIDPDRIALQYLTPLPGTPIYDEVEPFIEDHDLSHWDFHHPVVRTKYLTREDIGRLGAWSYSEFYKNPNRLERLFDERYHPIARRISKSFAEQVASFISASTQGKVYV